MPNFSITEQNIVNTINNNINININFNNQTYTIIECAKPTTRKGEPKTDAYVLLRNSNSEELEVKISIKQSNADFLENKTSAERAAQIFGTNWKNIIENFTRSVQNDFENEFIVFKNKKGNSRQGSFTLGWKFEFVNKAGRSKRTGIIPTNLSRIILKEVISGGRLGNDKRNASVNNRVIQDSGVANYILLDAETINLSNVQNIFSSLLTVDNYVNGYTGNVYFACKAHNYRSYENKADGPRPLSVYVNWYVDNNQLCSEICFNNPLIKGNIPEAQLLRALSSLSITSTDNLNSNNLSNNVNAYED